MSPPLRPLEETVRVAVRNELTLAKQHVDAARVLWESYHRADAIQLVRRALMDAVNGATLAAGDETQRFSALGLKPRQVALVEKALEAESAEYPVRDVDVTRAQIVAYGVMERAVITLQTPLVALTRTAGGRRARRMTVGLVALVTIAIAVSAVVYTLRPRVNASATAEWSSEFGAQLAVDGDESTDWILPDGRRGTLRLDLVPARDVHEVRLLNSKNAPFFQRSVEDYVVEAWVGDQKTAEASGTLAYRRDPQWTTVPLAAEGADRVLVHVRSFHRMGGGIAEAQIH